MPYWFVRLPLILLILLFAPHLAADYSAGADWLEERVGPDGVLGSDQALVSAWQASAAGAQALDFVGRSNSTALADLRGYLSSGSQSTTYRLAWRILTNATGQSDIPALILRLRTLQARNGAFGSRSGYTGTVLDTALALRAFAAAGIDGQEQPAGYAVGYLLDAQSDQGGWSQGTGAGNVFVTAQVMRSLQSYRELAGVSEALDAGREWLLAHSGSDGSFSDSWQTAVALLAIAPSAPSRTLYSDTRTALRDAQRDDGSWSGDSFTTALALQALAVASQPQPNPSLGSLELSLVDAEVGTAIEGARVTLSGPENHTAASSVDGTARFTELPGGEYSLDIEASGYKTQTGQAVLDAGEDLDLGKIKMLRVSGSDKAVLEGSITDGESGRGIPGARVEVSGAAEAATETDSSGAFHITGLTTGDVRVTVRAVGFQDESARLQLEAGTVATLNIGMRPAERRDVRVAGRVTAADTGAAIADADINVEGADTAHASTGLDGHYELTDLTPGELTISVAADGFRTRSVTMTADDGQKLNFSPTLVAETDPPEDPDTGGIKGELVDENTSAAVSDASITVLAGNTAETVTTDSEGRFELTGVSAGTVDLTVEHTDYRNLDISVELSAGVMLDLGTLALMSADTVGVDVQGTVVDSLSSDPVGGARVKMAVGEWKRIELNDSYESPVVVASPVSHNNGRSLSARVRNVTAESFELGVQMPCGKDAEYQGDDSCEADACAKEDVAWIVMEEGAWQLENGARVEAHRTRVDAVRSPLARTSDNPVIEPFVHSYSTPPVVLHGIMSNRDPAWVTSTAWGRGSGENDPPDRNDVRFALETAEVAPDHEAETIGWIAITPGEGSANDLDYAAGRSAGSIEGHEQGCFRAGIAPFDASSYTLASQLTRNGNNGGWLRFCNRGADDTEINVHVDEDRVGDAERGHTTEYAGWLAFARAGSVPLVADDGSTGSFEVGNATLSEPVVPRLAKSGADGHFSFTHVGAGQGTLELTADGYGKGRKPVFVPNRETDLGRLRIRPEGAFSVKPDLVALGVDGVETETTESGLRYHGSLTAEWANQGADSVDSAFILRAFVDVNGNNIFDEADRELGTARITENIARGAEESTSIDVAGSASFSEAPVSLSVDAGGDVIESDEDNNFATRALSCRSKPPEAAALEPQLQWKSRARFAGHDHPSASGPPAVGQLTDDNGDGRVDEDDVPDIVVPMNAGDNSSSDSLLGVFSGDDGRLVWAYHDSAGVRVSGRSTPAIGDVDGDGQNEIVTISFDGSRLLLFEQDGSLKWNIDSEQPARGSSSASHAPLITNLDQQGPAEIVVGNNAFSYKGELLWSGGRDKANPHFRGWGSAPIAADIHDSAGTEVSAGRTLYASDGSVIWHRDDLPGDGTTAIADLDSDSRPEIVLATSGRVIVLEASGETRWNVDLGTRGPGGPPTVADFDGDDRPEIGVAGGSRYVVLESDGTTKWTVSNDDDSSRATGSSVFDFDGDGGAEALYADESRFRIFDGTTGDLLTSIQNSSITKVEYPFVADVDNDGGAEIVLTSNPHTGEAEGVRVFEAANGQWAPTRSIWNQHSYHISNVNSDGSIPKEEEPFWQTHNTFRLNTFPERNALDQPDLVAHGLRLVDQGHGEPALLRMRVGSAGAIASEKGVQVRFYDGALDQGNELGSLTLEKLRPGAWQDIELKGIDPASLSGDDLYARIDPEGQLNECRLDNNTARTPPVTASTLGSIEVGTDANSYTPDETAQISAEATNQGRFSGAFSARLRIEDGNGSIVAEFDRTDLGELDSGASVSLSENWSLADTLAGAYTVVAELRDHEGNVVDRDSAALDLLAAEDGEPLATLRTATDRAVYSTNATVRVNHLAENVTTNGIIEQARLTTVITTPDGSEYHRDTTALGDLAAGAVRQRSLEPVLNNAPEGEWTVTARLHDGDNRLMATGSDTFTVELEPANRVQGSVEALHAERTPGEPQTCTEELSNPLDGPAQGLEIRRLVLNLTGENAVTTNTEVLDLAAGESIQRQHGFDTSGLEEGRYSCVLQVNTDTGWRNLDRADFRMKGPPIDIQPNVEAGDHGRVLILIDPPDAGTGRGDDAHGPKYTPGAEAQRDWLEARLDEAGWSYTIVTAGDAFRNELRTDQYAAVAFFHEHVKIAESVQHELVDRVKDSGLGLLVAGMHDRRNGRIEPALGLKSKGKLPHVDGLYLYDSEVTTADQFDFPVDTKPLRLDLEGANRIGKYTSDHPGGGPGNKGKGKKNRKGGGKNKGPKKPGPALTTFAYGDGHSIDAGFDLLLQGTAAGGENRFSELMLNALEHVHSDLEPTTHVAWPVKATLSNQGIATPGRLVLTLPAGAQVADAGPGTVNDAGQLIWTWQLDAGETRSATFWIRLPDEPGNAIFDAAIQTGTAPDWQPHRQVEYILNVISED